MFYYTYLFIIYCACIYSCCSVLIEGQGTQTVDDIMYETDP